VKKEVASREAEVALCASLMFDPRWVSECGELRPEHFYFPDTRAVYEGVRQVETDDAVNASTVAVWCARHRLDAFRAVGAQQERDVYAHLAGFVAEQLADEVALAHQAKVIREHWQLREIRRATWIATERADQSSSDPSAVIEELEGRLSAIAEQGQADKIRGVGKILGEVIPRMMEIRADGRGSVEGTATGYPDVDRQTGGLRSGELTVIAARPGQGKTSLLQALALSATRPDADGKSKGVLIFSAEMPAEQLAVLFACIEGRVDRTAVRQHRMTALEWRSFVDSAAALGPRPIWIDDSSGPSLSEIRGRTRQWIRRMERGQTAGAATELAWVAVDYLQLIREGESARFRNREQAVSEIARGLKNLSKELGIPVIALSQLSRNAAGKLPTLADLRESGEIEQAADNVWAIHRPASYDDTEPEDEALLLRLKNRHGPPGTTRLRWTGSCARFDSYGVDSLDDMEFEAGIGQD
jgi:replicative DNA helicase